MKKILLVFLGFLCFVKALPSAVSDKHTSYRFIENKGQWDKSVKYKTDFKGGKKNQDLWRQFYALAKNLKLKFIWVKGHADNAYNNRCDELAVQASSTGNLFIDAGYESGHYN